MTDLATTPLSVLDLATVASGSTEAEALRRSVELARHVEDLGYTRFWSAEHHSTPAIASTAPDLLALRVADATSRIRVGAGGVMLPNHSPLQVAERYLTLEAFHPGRIDLGIGRAPGTDAATAAALHRSDALDHERQLDSLAGFLDGAFPAGHPYAGIRAMPRGAGRPPFVLLSSSPAGVGLAARRGEQLAFAHHFAPHLSVQALRHYRQAFVPRPGMPAPYAILTVAVIAGETDTEAARLASSNGLGVVQMMTGRLGALPSPEEAEAHRWTSAERQAADSYLATQIVGGPQRVRQALQSLLAASGADELMITSTIHSAAAQRRSFEIVSEVARSTLQPA